MLEVHFPLFSFSRSYCSLLAWQRLQMVMAKALIFWLFRSRISFTNCGRIRQTTAYASVSSPAPHTYLFPATIRSNFSHSPTRSACRAPRTSATCEYGVCSKASSQLRAAVSLASRAMISSLGVGRWQRARREVILGGQTSLILLAMRRRVAASSSWLSSVKATLAGRRCRYATARYCVSLATFLVQARIHLTASLRRASSPASMELDEVEVVSVKLGREVLFCSNFKDPQCGDWWNFSCIFYYSNSNIEGSPTQLQNQPNRGIVSNLVIVDGCCGPDLGEDREGKRVYSWTYDCRGVLCIFCIIFRKGWLPQVKQKIKARKEIGLKACDNC